MKLRRLSILLCALLFLLFCAGCGAAPAAGRPEPDYAPAVTSPASKPEYGDLTT